MQEKRPDPGIFRDSKTFLIDIIAGARPNFMKIAPIIRAIQAFPLKCPGSAVRLDYRLIHTGQHYDAEMSDVFFHQLGIPEPHLNLNVGSDSQAIQTARIMVAYEKVLLDKPSDLCLVVGDVNSTMACAITARKANLEVAHVEAGIRSGDWSMPEEINRVVTDSISNWYFTTSLTAGEHLKQIGVREEQILFVGNTMIDTLLVNIEHARPPKIPNGRKLQAGQFILLTLHRPSNVDDSMQLYRVLTAIGESAKNTDVIFPIHPRTRKNLGHIQGLPENIIIIAPQPYLEFIWLVKGASGIITDSGGITEEATVLGTPCLTMRDSTERLETITVGTNELIGTDPTNLPPAIDRMLSGRWKQGGVPDKWDGQAASRIVSHLARIFS